MANNKNQLPAEPPVEPTTAPPLPAGAAEKPDDKSAVTSDQAEDPEIDQAVDDIATHEADEVLAAEDAELAKAFDPKAVPHGLKARVKSLVKAWWNNKKLRYGTFAGLAVLLIAIIKSLSYSSYDHHTV